MPLLVCDGGCLTVGLTTFVCDAYSLYLAKILLVICSF